MMRTTRILLSIITAAMLAGCSGEFEDQVARLTDRQEALESRLDDLEQENHRLRKALTAQRTAPVGTAVAEAQDQPAAAAVPPEVANALAQGIDTVLQKKVADIIEQRINSRIGTQDDIDAIFTEAVEEALENKEEEERLAREQRRRQQIAERDQRSVARRSEAAGLDDGKRDAVTLALQGMRETLRKRLAELSGDEATLEKKLAVAAESRRQFEVELAEALSEEELKAYYESDRWYEYQQGRVKSVTEAAGLDAEQSVLVDEAYTAMRKTIGDGFTLMGEGHASGGDMREVFGSSRDVLTMSLKGIMTPEQYQKYESSDASRWGRRLRGGRPF